MKYQEAIEYIEKCAGYGIVPGLDSIRELLRRLGNPEKKLKFVHIAGTNGKGSTLAFISTALTANGIKTGRYISPTIFEYRERFQIQGKPISKAEVGRLMEIVGEQADAMEQEGLPHPTPFEIETAMAFLLFEEKKCDLVVLETGMGGELDATNVVENTLVSVITGISRDHTSFLGNTLEEIAQQKAGIIKPGAMVVSAPQCEEVKKVLIAKTLQIKEAEKNILFKEDKTEAIVTTTQRITFIEPENIKKRRYGLEKQSFSYGDFENMEISLCGQYQLENAAVALQTLCCLQEMGYSMKEENIRKGFLETVWQGRFQILDNKPLFLVDGAHNADGAKELRKSLQFYFTNRRIIYIMGMFRDKEIRNVMETTCDLAEHIITVAAKGNPRALPSLELAKIAADFHSQVTAADSIEEAVELSYLLADKDTVIVAFGSLAYLGDCIKIVEHRKEMRKDAHGR